MKGYTVTIQGEQSMLAAIRRAGARIDDMTPLMRQVSQVLKFATEESFAGEKHASTGASWPRLAPSTVRSFVTKKRRRGTGPILQVTGRLAASVTTTSGKREAVIGSNVVYAAIHQFGGRAGRGLRTQIPARPYIGLTPTDAGEIETAALRFIEAALAQR